MNTIPHRASPLRRGLLALSSLVLTGLLAAQSTRPRPLWTREDLPPEHPVFVQTWQLDYEVAFHLKGSEQSDLDLFHRKLDFITDASIKGSVVLGGRSTAKTTGDPSLSTEAYRKRRFSRVSWESGYQRPPASARRDPFARHRLEVDYHANCWSWLRNRIDPAGGEDTDWSDTDEDQKVQGDGTKPITVVAWIEFDMETNTFELQLSLTDMSRDLPLTLTSKSVVRAGDHNGEVPAETQKKSSKVSLKYFLDHKVESEHWHGYLLQLQNRSFPPGAPESFVIEFKEPITSIAPELCPVGGDELAKKCWRSTRPIPRSPCASP